MRQYPVKSKPTQSCIRAMIAINQLKREFEEFQNETIDQFQRFQQQSMEEIINLWKIASGRAQSKRYSNKQKYTEQLKAAIEVLNQKQDYIVQLQNKVIAVQQSKQELLNILQRQTELCHQIRSQQENQASNFSNKVHSLQKVIKQKQISIEQLSMQSTVLKRLLKQEYQFKQNSIQSQHYLTNTPSRRQLSQLQNSQRLLKQRGSQFEFTKQGTIKRVSKDLKYQRVFKSSKLLKTPRRQSSNSIKSQIQKIIQKAVKQNNNKTRH